MECRKRGEHHQIPGTYGSHVVGERVHWQVKKNVELGHEFGIHDGPLGSEALESVSTFC